MLRHEQALKELRWNYKRILAALERKKQVSVVGSVRRARIQVKTSHVLQSSEPDEVAIPRLPS
jgi:hypothetical protein